MTQLQTVDLVINARWIIPVVPDNTCLEDHALVVNQGLIIALLPQSEAKAAYRGLETRELGEHLLIPGLINTHNHAAMSLLKGYADDFALQTWLEQHIWPAEGRHISADFVADGTELAMAEMIKTGTTCFADMYFFPDVAASAAQSAGMRAQITIPVLDFPCAWGSGPDDYLAKGEDILSEFKGRELLTIGFGPHAPYTVSDEPLLRIAELAEQWSAPVQIHVHETAFEVEQAMASLGMRQTERLHKLEFLNARTQCVHMTQVNDTDIAILQESGAHVVHCPESNLKLASGFCPINNLLQAGINVSIGTDGSASNNDLDMLGEIRTAAMLGKAVAGDASALDAHLALRMATLHGARTLGIADKVGSLEVGKQADLTAIAMNDLLLHPMYQPVSQLIYCNNSHRVSDVWVAGQALLKDKTLLTLDEEKIFNQARQWGDKIRTPSA